MVGAEVMGMTALGVRVPPADVGAGGTVGIRVMVEGIAVMIPGFLGIQAAQIPVK
jgi:hypothetical protein